jgi:hypothetical protein
MKDYKQLRLLHTANALSVVGTKSVHRPSDNHSGDYDNQSLSLDF